MIPSTASPGRHIEHPTHQRRLTQNVRDYQTFCNHPHPPITHAKGSAAVFKCSRFDIAGLDLRALAPARSENFNVSYTYTISVAYSNELNRALQEYTTTCNALVRLPLLSCCHQRSAHGDHSWLIGLRTWLYVCESCGDRAFFAICEKPCRLSCDFYISPCCCAAVLHDNIPVRRRRQNVKMS